MGDGPVRRPARPQDNTSTETAQICIRDPKWIRTHDPNGRAVEDGARLRWRGRCDRPCQYHPFYLSYFVVSLTIIGNSTM
jgi:hypothetical protein